MMSGLRKLCVCVCVCTTLTGIMTIISSLTNGIKHLVSWWELGRWSGKLVISYPFQCPLCYALLKLQVICANYI